jgi:hypothetical protein
MAPVFHLAGGPKPLADRRSLLSIRPITAVVLNWVVVYPCLPRELCYICWTSNYRLDTSFAGEWEKKRKEKYKQEN